MIIEEPRNLPSLINLPNFIGITPQKYEDCVAWRFSMLKDKLFIETKEEGKTINSASELLKEVSKHRHTFTCCADGDFDLFFKLFDRRLLFKLEEDRFFEFESYVISQMGRNKISIRKGSKWYSIYNIRPLSMENLDSISKIELWISKLKELNTLLKLNLNISSSSTSSLTMLLQLTYDILPEFRRIRKVSREYLDLIYSTIHNTWMETNCLGFVEKGTSIDSIKAHLRAIALVPSIGKSNTLISTSPKYTPEATMGFYLVEFDWPRTNHSLTSIRYKSKTTAPYGERVQYLAKPYLDKLTELKIPIKIHKAIEFLSVGEVEYPYKHFSIISEKVIDLFSDDLYPLNLKMIFYKTLVGNMQHFHISLDQPEVLESPDDVIFDTSQVFNPLVASTIYSIVNVKVWDLLSESNGQCYRRHDGITVTGSVGEIDKMFRKEKEGSFFTFTSIVHDNPGKDFWYGLANEFKDQTHIALVYPNRTLTRASSLNDPELIGKNIPLYQTIFPTPDIRLSEKVRRVGDLLEDTIEANPISVDEVARLPSIQKYSYIENASEAEIRKR